MAKKQWITEGFEAFRKGTFGNGGQNIYVSKEKGVLQRIYQYDLTHNGYFDLAFANCQNHGESAPSYVYSLDGKRLSVLKAMGSHSAVALDLSGDGWTDIVLAGFSDAATAFALTEIYYGSKDGYSDNNHIRLPAPVVTDCCAGRFNGGRPALALAQPDYGQIRIFYQSERAFEWHHYIDIPIKGGLVTAADLDGDGCDELIVRDADSTATTIYWGGQEGIVADRKTMLPKAAAADILTQAEEKNLTSDFEKGFTLPRLLQTVVWKGQQCFTLSTGRKVIFFGADSTRTISRVAEFDVKMVQAVAVADIDGDGLDDVVFASREVRDGKQYSQIWFNSPNGFTEERKFTLETKNASCADAAPGMALIGQSGAGDYYTNDALLFTFENGKLNTTPRRFEGENTMDCKIIRNPGQEPLIFLCNNHSRRIVGSDTINLYTGGPDGYTRDRCLKLPGWCAVDTTYADIDDDGWAELIVDNNSENSMNRDPGHHVHHFGPNGFEPERTFMLKSDLGWNTVVGDFRHCGVLDIIGPCNMWTDIRIWKGDSPNYSEYEDIHLNGHTGIRWILAADLNNDGWLDLIVPFISDTRTVILWGGPEGFSMTRRTELAVYMGSCARVADLNKNGWLDLIIGCHTDSYRNGDIPYRNPHSSYMVIYWNGPEGLSEQRKCMLRTDASNSIAVADFNRDGWLDIFAGNYHGGKDRDINSLLYWNREGHFDFYDRQEIFTHSASGCIAADFNEDGWIDLAVANHKVYGDHVGESYVFWNGPEGIVPSHCTKLPTCGPHGMTAVEPGNQLDRGPLEFYYSEPRKMDEAATVENIDVTAEIPPKTWVECAVRCAATAEALEAAEWQKPEGFKAPAGSLLQYRLALGATNSLRSPRITKVTVNFR